jgi:hypothetical protein
MSGIIRGVKRKNKIKRKAQEARLLLDIAMAENPDDCFCEELLGLKPDFDQRLDKPAGHYSGWGGSLRNVIVEYPYFLCNRCGKRAQLNIVFA